LRYVWVGPLIVIGKFHAYVILATANKEKNKNWKKNGTRSVLTGLSIKFKEPRHFFYLICEAIGTAANPGLLCQPRVIVQMIVEKQMECILTGETEVLGENLPQRHFCPSQNSTWPGPDLNPGRRCGKPETNRLSYGVATSTCYSETLYWLLLKQFVNWPADKCWQNLHMQNSFLSSEVNYK
jgi:hypothetical protein